MKKMPFVWVKYTLLFSLFALAGCHKFDWDMWHKHNPDCRISKIKYFREFSPDSITAVFKYNHSGQPVSVVYDYVSTGRPNLVFEYDHKGRLTDYIAPYDNDNYEVWFTFKHDYKGRIISDTQHVFGQYIDSQPLPSTYLAAPGFYEYDQWDRVIKETRYLPQNNVEVWLYEYNAEGNLATVRRNFNGNPFGVWNYTTYDNKVNLLRTNPIWMFITRNYSKNNQITADAYNSKGLPTRFRAADFNVYRVFHETDLSKSDIEYKCK